MEKLINEYEWYLCNKKKLLKKYLNKYLIIKDNTIINSCDNYDEARQKALKKYKIGDFIIQQVLAKEPIILVSC